MDEVEKLLLLWIHEEEHAGDTVTETVICAKAKALHADLIAQQPRTYHEDFKASHGWFKKLKNRSSICSVVRHGEAGCSDLPAAEEFATKFSDTVTSEGYLPEQIFNCDKTGLFWKWMPKRTFITQEETKMPGHKPMKDCLNLLFCSNFSGRLKALVTCVLFVEWVNQVFGPIVKQYLQEKNLPLKAVLLVDNEPPHLPGLEDLVEEFSFILPPNTNTLIQPMDQQLTANFRKLYTRELFWPSTQEPAVVEEIISLGRSTGLEVSEEDVTELVEGHTLKRSTKELQQQEQQGLHHGTLEEQEEEGPRQVPLSVLRRACELWGQLQTLVNEHHEQQAEAQELVDQFDTEVIAPWRAVLQKRQRQQTMDWFAVKQVRQEEEPPCSAHLPSSASFNQKLFFCWEF
ncbi:hypothetical protein JRQ81_005935 [Phrynocephalus forsythii]|uniref:HTH CENPB-type domain-containing protein n=1 Tax=Phrynocephalus forsythii TaxID=171643 RepID=A0A9Q0Y5I2_9SAUR|nr:hypothetical protein JRQ81_005935 [Phrynocephalus forsythii]